MVANFGGYVSQGEPLTIPVDVLDIVLATIRELPDTEDGATALENEMYRGLCRLAAEGITNTADSRGANTPQ